MENKNKSYTDWWVLILALILVTLLCLYSCTHIITNISISLSGQVEEVTNDDRDYNRFIDETSSLNLQIKEDSIKLKIGR